MQARRVFLPMALFVAVCTSGAYGDTTNAEKPHQLDDSIIVTANRTGLAQNNVLWPVVVLSEREISRHAELAAPLDGAGGLDVRQYNGIGSNATLSNWGVFNRQMLLLYNGRVVKDYSLGGFDLSAFSADEFERVEIVKGPQSAFFGPDAVGGVINLVPRRMQSNSARLMTVIGSHGLVGTRLEAARAVGSFRLSGFGERARSDNARENAGARRQLFHARLDYADSLETFEFSLGARYFQDSLGVPGPVPDPSFIPVYGGQLQSSLFDHQEDDNVSIDSRFATTIHGWRCQFDGFWERKQLDFNALYNYQSFYYTPDPSPSPDDSVLNIDSVDVHARSLYDKRSAGVNFRVSKQLTRLQLAAGLDWHYGALGSSYTDTSIGTNISGPSAPFEYGFSSYSYWWHSQNQYDVWLALLQTLKSKTRVDLSSRYQFINGRRGQPSYNVGCAFNLSEELSFRIGYGYAYRLPTLAEQFAEDAYTRGNDELEPERSHTVAMTTGWREGTGWFSANVSLYHQEISSLIQYRYNQQTFKSTPLNVETFQSDGVDVSVAVRPAAEVQVRTSAVIQRAKQSTDNRRHLIRAFYIPTVKSRTGIDVRLHRSFLLSTGVTYTGERYIIMFGGQEKRLKGVMELFGSADIQVSRAISLLLSGEDLTNERRPDQFGFTPTDRDYPGVGRRVSVKLIIDIM